MKNDRVIKLKQTSINKFFPFSEKNLNLNGKKNKINKKPETNEYLRY